MVLCLALAANVFTRTQVAEYSSPILPYAAGCECAYWQPGEVDGYWAAAKTVGRAVDPMPVGNIAFKLDDGFLPPALMYFMMRFALWQNTPLQYREVSGIWGNDPPDVQDRANQDAAEWVEFLTRKADCGIVISVKECGAWVIRERIPGPIQFQARCRRQPASG